LKREKYNPNVYRELTPYIKERLRQAILDAIRNCVRERRQKTYPPAELIQELVSEDVRRIIERLSDGLVKRHIDREYFVVYKGPRRRGVKVIKVGTENMVLLKEALDDNKPSWATRCKAYPIAYQLPDDECYPFTCFWPQVTRL